MHLPRSLLYTAVALLAASGMAGPSPWTAPPHTLAAQETPNEITDEAAARGGASERAVVVSPDVTIRVQEYPGVRETVVMLPGAGMDVAALGEIPQRLAAEGYHVLAVNPRGAAGSMGPVDGITLHDLAADVAGVVEQLGGGPAHLLGHAGGNRIGRCLAADRPDLVRSVILLAAGGLVPPDPETARVMDRVFAGELVPEAEHHAILLAPSSDPRVLDSWVIWPEAQRAFQSAASSTPIDEWWAGGGARMLVMQGLEDKVAPPGNGRALAGTSAGNVRLVEIPNAGHALPVEQPGAVVDATLAWLTDIRAEDDTATETDGSR
ncbi:MAG: alpha/beta hydrolase [Chloroflexi bacterium]|nr:alpha/beta hydrolase [Chloroflexota bacterium]